MAQGNTTSQSHAAALRHPTRPRLRQRVRGLSIFHPLSPEETMEKLQGGMEYVHSHGDSATGRWCEL